ncbi:MAG: hypothetical protein IJ107_04375, partial [Lachnospiraceae bacterium]|nr:hypothetical protein [Lachnospiraceae bacterium]
MKAKAESKEIKIINPVRKCVTGMIIAAVLSIIVWMIMLVINILSTQEGSNYVAFLTNEIGTTNKTISDMRYEGIFRTAEEIAYNIDEANSEYFNQCQRKADLSARACYDRVSELGDAAIGKLGQGGIVKIENGEVTLGDGMRWGIRNYPEMAANSGGMFDYVTPTMNGSRRDTLVYSRIKGPYYYVEIVDGREILDYVDKYVDYVDELMSIEAAYEVDLALVCPDRENSKYFYNLDTDLVFYFPVTFNEEEGGSTADFGIPSTREELLALNGQVAAGNPEEAKSFLVREVPELDCVLVMSVRLPGIDISKNGTISYQGQPISRFTVEGLDLTGGSYGRMTNRLKAQDVDKAEVIEHDQPVKALQGKLFSDDVALNIKLKDTARDKWLSTIAPSVEVGDDLYPGGSADVLQVGSKRQQMYSVNMDRTGKELSYDHTRLGSSFYSSPEQEISVPSWFSMPSLSAPIDAERLRRNLSHDWG